MYNNLVFDYEVREVGYLGMMDRIIPGNGKYEYKWTGKIESMLCFELANFVVISKSCYAGGRHAYTTTYLTW